MRVLTRKRAVIVAGAAATLAVGVGVGGALAGDSGDPQLAAAPTSHTATHQAFNAGAHVLRRVQTEKAHTITSSTTFTEVPNAKVAIPIPAGQSRLIGARFTAESRCNGPGTTNDWCEIRILIRGEEAYPQASTLSPNAFDSTDSGTEGFGSWEDHSFEGHRCVRNNNPASQITANVVVERKATLFGDSAPEFWLDDYTLTADAFVGSC